MSSAGLSCLSPVCPGDASIEQQESKCIVNATLSGVSFQR